MFGVGPGELLIVALVGFLLFGNRLPSLMRSLGSSISEFKRGLQDVNDQLKQ
jgi:sec-independent protein translocase protein TatA